MTGASPKSKRPYRQTLANLNLDHKIKNLTHKLNEHSITLIKTRYALLYNLNYNSQGAGLGATAQNPP